MSFQTVFNEYTKQKEVQFQATLVSVSDKELENSNGKPYRVATVSFENVTGDKVQRSAIIYKGNFDKGMEIGNSYLCTASLGVQGTLIRMSHLEQAARATADDFGDLLNEVEAPARKEGQIA